MNKVLVMLFSGVVLWSGAAEAARTECVVIRSLTSGETWISDAHECAIRTSPASTFKIPNTVIALETGVITDLDTVTAWDGTPQPIAPWNQDHSTRTAMRESVVWFYRDVARRIGAERMHEGLQRIGYPRQFEGSVDMFWLDGRIRVSPIDQVKFLSTLFGGRSGARPASVSMTRELIFQPGAVMYGFPDLPLEWPAGAELRAKTGNVARDDDRSSWLVGEARCGDEAFVFASRVRDDENLPRRTSVALAMKRLNRIAPESCD